MSSNLKKQTVTTAQLVAAIRARHQEDSVRVIDDPYALQFCNWFFRFLVRFRVLQLPIIKQYLDRIEPVSLCILMRARYADQALEQAIKDGISQYIILGAGLDTFAFRRSTLMEQIDVYEVDQPVTQQDKLASIRRLGLQVPSRLHFLEADLNRISPIAALAGSSFDPTRPAFISLLGVTYYLTADALAATVKSISEAMPAGTCLIFDYLLDRESVDNEHLECHQRLKDFVRKMGEPMLGEYSISGMNDLMAKQGFISNENISLIELEKRYTEELGELPIKNLKIIAIGNFRVSTEQ